MKLFYKKLTETFEKEEIKDLYRKKGLIPVQFIDLYAEQDLIPEWFEVHHYPALLVSWDISYSNDTAVANIIFYICYNKLIDKERKKYYEEIYRHTNRIINYNNTYGLPVKYHTK